MPLCWCHWCWCGCRCFCREKINSKASVQYGYIYTSHGDEQRWIFLDYSYCCRIKIIAIGAITFFIAFPLSLSICMCTLFRHAYKSIFIGQLYTVLCCTHYTMFVNPRELVWIFFKLKNRVYVHLSLYIHTQAYAHVQWQWITITFSSQSIIWNVLTYSFFSCFL